MMRLPPRPSLFPYTTLFRSRADTVMKVMKIWRRIAQIGELPADVTPHVLRHSFASLAGDMGYSEPTIGALIGHKGHSVTSRYIDRKSTRLNSSHMSISYAVF